MNDRRDPYIEEYEEEQETDEAVTAEAQPEENPEEKPEEKKSRKEEKKEEKEDKKECRRLAAENEKLTASLAELTDRYTRMLAEYDNFRKRAAKEKDGVYTDATADILNQILPVKDSLEMAMAFADDGKLSKGVTMTLQKFDEVLTRMDVEPFGTAGDAFDPDLHNAVLHEEDETLGENVIKEVLLKGYKKGDRIIRYAMVKVAN